jgi:WhiB family transcriptional regulator, redox-sensing transcriptional regulator
MDDESLWRDSAACQGADPELFFPLTESGRALVQIRQAKEICRVCQVQRACLTWALQHAMSEGIWGGSTESERRAIVADLNGRRAFLRRASRVQSGTGGQRP